MTSWGRINAKLNRLVHEGVITGFKTNLAEAGHLLGLHVIVMASIIADHRSPGFDPEKVEEVREKVAHALEPVTRGATVTVAGSLPEVS